MICNSNYTLSLVGYLKRSNEYLQANRKNPAAQGFLDLVVVDLNLDQRLTRYPPVVYPRDVHRLPRALEMEGKFDGEG